MTVHEILKALRDCEEGRKQCRRGCHGWLYKTKKKGVSRVSKYDHIPTDRLSATLAWLETARGGWYARLVAWAAAREIEAELRERTQKPQS